MKIACQLHWHLNLQRYLNLAAGPQTQCQLIQHYAQQMEVSKQMGLLSNLMQHWDQAGSAGELSWVQRLDSLPLAGAEMRLQR